MLQGIRDYGRTFADRFTSSDPSRVGTPEWQADVAEATRRLGAVRDDGRSLDEFSDTTEQRVMDHDRERADESVKALNAMGILPSTE